LKALQTQRGQNCYDNAKIESVWSTLKTESDLHVCVPATRDEARLAVRDYIATFYNPKRHHSSLGQIPPVAFELKHTPMHTKSA